MPHADPAAKRAYMRVYLRERYRSDPDYREAKKASRRVRGRRLYRENAEYRERVKASAKLWANSRDAPTVLTWLREKKYAEEAKEYA